MNTDDAEARTSVISEMADRTNPHLRSSVFICGFFTARVGA
jgi:hypothetical protein